MGMTQTWKKEFQPNPFDIIIKFEMTRSAQPHVHTYMFCPYVISTLYWLLEEYK
jgi:hypothetical protein